nr:MAG TPA: hypothetical protein [Caudoviricetes sp.]
MPVAQDRRACHRRAGQVRRADRLRKRYGRSEGVSANRHVEKGERRDTRPEQAAWNNRLA